MNMKNGGPAFPSGLESGHLEPLHQGLTLRDYFAAIAMQGILAEWIGTLSKDELANWSYTYADAMLAAREAA